VDGDRDLTLGAAGSFNPLVSFQPSELQGAGMTAARLPMRQIREVLRLHYSSGLSQHAIARSLGMSQGAVSKYLAAARRAGLTWPLSPELDDDIKLEALLFPPPPNLPVNSRPLPDWASLHRDLRRPGVTLNLLWEEYRAGAADGVGYSWFCDLYRAWTNRVTLVMRQVHIAGEKLFVDYSGHTMEVVDGATGEVQTAQIFVAVMGASHYVYVEATSTQKLPDWIASHVRAFNYFGGATKQIVPDNLKSGVTKACLYEPTINRTYADLARHYSTAICPARPRRPRDKSKVEVGVQIVSRWILARLRNKRFFSLAALNGDIRALLDDLNKRPLRGWGRSRRDLFEELDRPALNPLPAEPYEYAEWKRCRVNIDYHVEVDKHYYSAPHSLVRQELEVRLTVATVELFHHGKRIASYLRSNRPHQHTTLPEHMPSSHRRYRDWTHERIQHEAKQIGPQAAALVDLILRSKPHPEQGFRSCVGIVRLVKRYPVERVEAACARALALNTRSYTSVVTILKNKAENPTSSTIEESQVLVHHNIRGAGYYH
jgi:transposase